MSKIRVYELARELGLSSREVIERLAKAGIPVKSHSSSVNEAVARVTLSVAEISTTNVPQEARRKKPAAQAKRAKRIRKRAEAKPVPKSQVAADKETVGEPKPAPAPPKPEASTDPPTEPERPEVEIRRPETPVIGEPTRVEERPPAVTAEPVPSTAPSQPRVKEPMSPTVPQVLTIPEMITVKDLGEKLATTPGEIVKKVMKRGITATVNQNLDPELVKHVAAEFGFDVEVVRDEEVGELVGEVDSPIRLEPPEPVPGVEAEQKPLRADEARPVPKVVTIPEMITVKDLGEKLATTPGEIVKKVMKRGITATVNQNLDPELVKHVAAEFGFDVEVVRDDEPVQGRTRPPVVTIIGDVDHDKTSQRQRRDDIPASLQPTVDDVRRRIKEKKKERKEKEQRRSTSPATAIAARTALEQTRPYPSRRSPTPWVLMGALVVVGLLALAMPRENGTSSPTSLDEGQRIAAIPPLKAAEPPPRHSAQPQEWKILHHLPRAGQAEQSRRKRIRIFFNRPVEQNIVELAFSIFPPEPGTFSWPKPDRLVFTPKDTLLPATEYTVSLTPISGSHSKGEYTLLEARWSFTTRDIRTYRTDIKPLIAAYCYKCHGPKGRAARIPLQTSRDVGRYVIPGRSEESRLYTFLREEQHHINMAGPNHSTNDKLAVIRDWINEDGAAE